MFVPGAGLERQIQYISLSCLIHRVLFRWPVECNPDAEHICEYVDVKVSSLTMQHKPDINNDSLNIKS